MGGTWCLFPTNGNPLGPGGILRFLTSRAPETQSTTTPRVRTPRKSWFHVGTSGKCPALTLNPTMVAATNEVWDSRVLLTYLWIVLLGRGRVPRWGSNSLLKEDGTVTRTSIHFLNRRRYGEDRYSWYAVTLRLHYGGKQYNSGHLLLYTFGPKILLSCQCLEENGPPQWIFRRLIHKWWSGYIRSDKLGKSPSSGW